MEKPLAYFFSFKKGSVFSLVDIHGRRIGFVRLIVRQTPPRPNRFFTRKRPVKHIFRALPIRGTIPPLH